MTRSFQLAFIKIKHQPRLLIVLVMCLLPDVYVYWATGNGYFHRQLWFPTYLLVLNCLEPFIISLIVATQLRFENQRSSFNLVLSLPSRTKWLLTFTLNTCLILFALLLVPLLLVINHFPMNGLVDYAVSLGVLGLVWVPLLVDVGLIHGYLACLLCGAVSLPFMIYYGTSTMGIGLWQCLPWVWNVKVFTLLHSGLGRAVLVSLITTVLEQLVANWRFNRKEG